ncbi:MAG: carboxypeptidase-like regulatory domain-containing protein [Vicinamibacteraceae bacterium]
MALALVLCALMATAPRLVAQSASNVVRGYVTDEHGAPLTGVTVIATDEGGSAVAARTDEVGAFRLVLPSGPRRFDVSRGSTSRQTRTLVLVPGETTRLDIVLPSGETAVPSDTSHLLSPVTAFVVGPAPLADLPLDRADASAAVLALAPGLARGTAFGAADVATSRRLDGLDLSDPLDGSAWTSFILPAATSASVRAGVGANERDGSGAILDIVTRAGGAAFRGIVDVAGGGRAWSRDTLPDDALAANPGLIDRERTGRSLRAAAVLSGPLTPQLGFGLAAEFADDARADSRAAVTRTPRVHGRLDWAPGARRASVVGFVDKRSTTKDVPFALRSAVAPGVENDRTSNTIASRATWQSPLRDTLRLSASVDVLRGTRTTRPTSDVPARQDDVTGAVTGSLGLVQEGERTRTIAGGALDWRTPRMGGHDVRAGGEFERTQVTERASFSGGEFFHDLAGRADTVDVWSGSDRQIHLGREAVFVTDTWTPGRRLAITGGVRAAHLRGGAYRAMAVQPRVGVTLAIDRAARVVARASAGIVADPLLATHVDRTVGGETPVVTFQILGDGRRAEVGRTTPTIAGVGDGIRHPQVREVTGGGDIHLSKALQVGGTVFLRRFLHPIDTVLPDARWLALTRAGLDGRALTIYRWLNRRVGDAPMITNVDGTTYRAPDNQPIGVAAAGRDYAGLIGHVQLTLPRDRGSLAVAITSARSRGTIDDTHAAGVGRSDRFASPTAALIDVDGPSTLTPDLAITIFGTTRVPLLPIRVSGIYQRLSGSHYAAQRTLAATTLDVPFGSDGRTVFLEPRGSRVLDPVDDLSLRLASRLPFGQRRPVEVYADVYNVLGGHTVTAVETTSPVGVSSGTPLVFEAPTDVQRPFRIVLGGRLTF